METFSFGFSGDDIEEDDDIPTGEPTAHVQPSAIENLPKPMEARKHDIKELVPLIFFFCCFLLCFLSEIHRHSLEVRLTHGLL